MKKLIALLLAVLMALSMMAFVGAEELDETFTDAGDITLMNKESVSVLNNMGIIKGMTETTFVPNNTLTRAQAAKILAMLTLGVSEAENQPVTSTFSDVPTSHWACKYVTYCASKGIVAGVGNGKFNPDGKLTGFAFGKMVLVATGTDPEAAGLTGANWDKNVNKLLKEQEFNKGVTISSKDLSRQNACHVALNALFYGEETDAYSTLAYKTFQMTRAQSGNGKNYEWKRPLITYTTEESDLLWDGTDLTVFGSPFLIYEGAFTCGKLYTDLGNKTFDTDHIKGFRNGCNFDPSTFETYPTADSSLGFMCAGTGVTTEWYYDAATQIYTHVQICPRVFKIVDVVDPDISADGTVVSAGSVTITYEGNEYTCECNEFTTADVGGYAICYTNGPKWREVKAIVSAEKPKVITGKLQSEDLKLKIDGKSYPVLLDTQANRQDGLTPYPQNYIAAGGNVGDTINAIANANGVVFAIVSAN